MYAVIQTGGKQYRVAVGDRLKVESLDAEVGNEIKLGQVLMISDEGDVQVGGPVLDDSSVSAKVLSVGRGEKIRVFKMNRRKGYRRTQGHRQNFTEIEVTSINAIDADKPKKKAASVKSDKPIEKSTADDSPKTAKKVTKKVDSASKASQAKAEQVEKETGSTKEVAPKAEKKAAVKTKKSDSDSTVKKKVAKKSKKTTADASSKKKVAKKAKKTAAASKKKVAKVTKKTAKKAASKKKTT